jgi:beta-N-acetylhexosaminidase
MPHDCPRALERLLVFCLVAPLASLSSLSFVADAAPAARHRTPAQVLGSLTLRQKVGQLLMVSAASTSVDSAAVAVVKKYHLGGVVLIGNSTRGVSATRKINDALHGASAPLPLLVAVDQEGGTVQRLKGPGFSRMPSALTMGGWKTATVQSRARTWGKQLRKAGVDVDLAPVLDTVPYAKRNSNLPIGSFHREFGYTPTAVERKGVAFQRGIAASGTLPALKHFPGLGRVKGNTDNARNVTDRVTVRHDAYLAPFRAGVKAGAPFVMVSSARYTKIDAKHPAVFSPTVIRTMLRGDLGFEGVVISDSLSTAQVAGYTPGRRAVAFVRSGGDMALTTAPSQIGKMYAALLARAKSTPSFRKLVDAAARRIIEAKQQAGLL